VNIQINIVACLTYPDEIIRYHVVATFSQLSVVIVTLPMQQGYSTVYNARHTL